MGCGPELIVFTDRSKLRDDPPVDLLMEVQVRLVEEKNRVVWPEFQKISKNKQNLLFSGTQVIDINFARLSLHNVASGRYRQIHVHELLWSEQPVEKPLNGLEGVSDICKGYLLAGLHFLLRLLNISHLELRQIFLEISELLVSRGEPPGSVSCVRRGRQGDRSHLTRSEYTVGVDEIEHANYRVVLTVIDLKELR